MEVDEDGDDAEGDAAVGGVTMDVDVDVDVGAVGGGVDSISAFDIIL